ncbi:hypothetical protein PS49_198 [Aeromonas phage PS49]
MATSITLAPLNPTIKVGDSHQFTATLTGAPEGSTVTYEWKIDDVVQSSVTNTLDYTASTTGTKVVKVTSTTKVDAQPDDVQTATTNLTVNAAEPEIPAECPILYVHPLPWRSSAYIWAGWWVMDAIQKLTEEGKDWKTATASDTPYYCHLATLAKMIADYPEVDVQESRNGRIVHRTALDAGIIY